jgi:hypothetical protein
LGRYKILSEESEVRDLLRIAEVSLRPYPPPSVRRSMALMWHRIEHPKDFEARFRHLFEPMSPADLEVLEEAARRFPLMRRLAEQAGVLRPRRIRDRLKFWRWWGD